ncbi:unnamed protein product [Brachionus calyciflorus]|uniref:Uncharacterized protein n=1 Tax=Brachionus calyciflorus TaxID=104777 RepID=A0A813VHP5_9BILA|nr:unnamed protein product [Brachionus calyciflorus]
MSTESTDVPNVDTSSNQKHFTNLNAQLITGVNREIKQAPNVDNIIEEEEEEEEEDDDDDDDEEEGDKLDKNRDAKIENIVTENNNNETPDKPKPKFVLETVVLENNEPVCISSVNRDRLISHTEAEDNSNDREEVEVQEIKVEEGYATRQMDEFFRQTIAAIKEELTKKLENKNDKKVHHHHHHNHKYHKNHKNDEIEEFDSDSPYDYDYDLDDDGSDMENINYNNNNNNKSEFETSFRCNNRSVLFQNLLALTNKKPSRIDRINSWLVLLGCMLNQFLVDGLCFNYVNFMDRIGNENGNQSKLMSSMPGVFMFTFLLLMSPIALFLNKQYGIRPTSLIGSLLTSFSILISSFFINNFVLFNLFYGVFSGIGLSLVYVSTIIATSKWFVKKRLFASCLNVLGACSGAVIYPLLTEYILRRYNLSNTLIIISSIQMNALVGSMLLFDHKNQFLASTKVHKVNTKSLEKTPIRTRKPTQYDLETVSQISTSTNPNLTLKQYWRKFIQTRKSQSNTKKNLFHLIAEEKRKTRTMSKTSLEDGFVITTSNNLLAPNDDSNVIVTRQAKLSMQQQQQQKPRLITRIANSLRSLTHSNSPKINEPVIPLMSVFDGPLNDSHHETTPPEHHDSDSDEDANLFNANIPKINPKNARYLSYRNSLTNSVRGSLMECSVPEEDREEEEVNSGCDGTCSVDDDELCSKKIQRQSRRRSHLTRLKPLTNNNGVIMTENLKNGFVINNQENSVGYSMPTILNLRRFISTIETSSFLNIPLNLEPIEYNLRNCFIKKSADSYRNGNFSTNPQENTTLFLDYLAYILNFRLFINRLLIILNFSFLLNTAAYTIILFYISNYSRQFGMTKLESIYILCLIGLTCGLGRVVSTISYKVNESNSKSRIFAYVLTLFLNAGCVYASRFLCDTLFSFSMFAIVFGILLGFNLNLRALFLYDVIGLEWSDDSLFFYGIFSQAIGICAGVPLAGFLFDYFHDVFYVIYTAGAFFLISGLILLPGRELRTYCKNSVKSINKFYILRKNVGN